MQIFSFFEATDLPGAVAKNNPDQPPRPRKKSEQNDEATPVEAGHRC